MIVNTPGDVRRRSRSLRIVPLARVRWDDYDLVKTSYHLGFANLLDQGVGPNPLILARLGCVVGAAVPTTTGWPSARLRGICSSGFSLF